MRGRPALFVVPAYLAATLLLTWPMARDFGQAVPAVFGENDPLLQSFLLGWVWQALPRGPVALFNAPIFHPHPLTLTYMDHMIGEALLGWPVLWMTERHAAAVNFVVLLSFVLSGWAVYRLLRGLGAGRAAGFIGGLLFAFGPYRICNLGNLNQLQTQFLPLALHFGLRWFRGRRLRNAVGAAACLVVQAWFGWYYFFHIGLALALLALYEWGLGRVEWRRLPWGRLAMIAAATLAVVVPGVIPYWIQQHSMTGFRRTLGMAALWSADLFDYLKYNSDSRLGTWWPAGTGPQGYWPGLTAAPLALLGAWSLARGAWRSGAAEPLPRVSHRRGDPPLVASRWLTLRVVGWIARLFRNGARSAGPAGFFGLAGAAAFLLSLGPVLQYGGQRTVIPMPYTLAYFVFPGFASMRAPSRFAGLVLLAAAVLAGLGFQWLWRRRTGRTSRAALFGGAIALSLFSAWSTPVPMVELPRRETLPPVYEWLARQPHDRAVLEIPVPQHDVNEGPYYARQQFAILFHGHPRLDGTSGFTPPEQAILRMVLQNFPRPGALRAAVRSDAYYVIVHYDAFQPARAAALRAAVAAEPGLVLESDFGADVAYRLDPGAITR